MSTTRWIVAGTALLAIVCAAAWTAMSYGLLGGSALAAPALPSPSSGGRDQLVGSWRIDDGDGTWVGYRVFEPAVNREITGRTEEVSASLELTDDGGDQLVVSRLEVTADLRALTSDAEARDRALRGRLLESNRFPQARFTADDAVAIPAGAARRGEVIAIDVPGTLTVRDVARPVTLTADVRAGGAGISVAGQAPLALSDFDIVPPAASPLVDDGRIEFQATFTR